MIKPYVKKFGAFAIASSIMFSGISQADLVLGEKWESKKISGYSGKLYKIKTDEFWWRVTENKNTPNENTYRVKTNMGIYGLDWYEKANNPCRFEIKRKALNEDLHKDKLNHELNSSLSKIKESFCQPSGSSGKKKISSSGKNVFAIGVSVCTTTKKDTNKNKVKGIRLHLGRIIDAKVHDMESHEGNLRKHCKKWHKPVMCPPDYIVSGLKIYRKKEGKAASGMGVMCREVKEANTPYIGVGS